MIRLSAAFTRRVVAGANRVQVVGFDRAEDGLGAVGEHDLDGSDVVYSLAVAKAARPGRVVADHPANRRAIAR